LAGLLGGVEIHSFEGDVHRTMEQIAGVGLFVTERLHGAVAAVSLGVPCVPLSYASKCDDFWLSITDVAPTITPDSTTAEIAAELARATRGDQVASFAPRVQQLRARLADAAARIRAWTSGEGQLE
jgi:polysaccharide pyruvyl transferase WcaK-like protein